MENKFPDGNESVSFLRSLVSLPRILFVATGALLIGALAIAFSGFVTRTKAQNIADDKNIGPDALQQIAALIDEKESRTPSQRKIDSRLLYTVKMTRGEAIAEGVPTLETGLHPDGKGFIEVDITAFVDEKLLATLEQLNADIILVLPQYRSITAGVPISEIESLAARAEVIFIQPRLEATTSQPRLAEKPKSPLRSPLLLQPSGAAEIFQLNRVADFQTRATRLREVLTAQLVDHNLTGSVNSQADTTHRAGLARTLTGFDGTGLKIGVLSDGVNTLAARQATGDLPATVNVLPGQAGSGDEGTAMLELVYDLAPGAQLYFATAFTGITSFAQNIKDLRTAGCDIIIDDVSYFVESPFQNGQSPSVISPTNAGVVIQAVNDVTVGSQAGALYFSSAANSGNKNDGTAGAWEGDFVSGGGTTAPLPLGNSVHNFGGGVTQNALTVGGRVYLKWSDPLGASSNDYDLYVLDSTGTTVVASSTNVQSGTQDPSEDAGNRSAGQRIVIVQKSGAANRFLHLNTNRGVLTVSTNGVVYGHNAGLNTVSVAATPSGPATFDGIRVGPFPNAHSGANVVEQFSSDGPRRIFYNADSSAITPGNVSSTGGQLLQKPDITAADGSSTTTPGFIPFFGTSAAAPHAGAMMALLKQSSPSATNAQLYNAMVNSAIDIEAPGVDRDSGAGIFMPLRAMNALGVSAPATLETGTITATEAVGNGNGRIEPGEVVNLTIPLNNLGLTNATAVSGTLSTATAGVTVTNTLAPSALSCPNLPAAVGTGVTGSPFRFALSSSFPCGAPIDFTLTVNYAGGAAPSQVFNFTVNTNAQITINETIDSTAPASGAGYTAVTGTQTGRLNRNGSISSCSNVKSTPALQDSTVGRRYDAYTFTASTSGCTTVTLATTFNNSGNNMYVAVYGNGGYVPSAIQTNYLADWGVTTGGTVTVGFNAVAGQQFTVVVHEIALGAGTGQTYTLTVTGPLSGACAAVPTAANVQIRGRVASAAGSAVANALVRLTGTNGSNYTARTNSFGSYTIDDVAVGETYVADVRAKGFTFIQQIVSVGENIDGLDFTAVP